MIFPLFEVSIPQPRQRHHGGGSDGGVGICAVSIDGEWCGHTVGVGPDGFPVLRRVDHDAFCELLRTVIDALD